ncbi:hypothetical protein [Streptomyces sp. I05A-00742]|uniref:hypothetical protein n=1 Tax=Streptomyces sp. I05A-00742 TaxID=2732853 RepID=UPI001489D750|nr:hypothetical protein [Streptomyces sp. I05A-00742]
MRRTARKAALTAVLCALAAGCGIRGTAVPVDAGSAPSRASCLSRPGTAATPPAGGNAVTVQLVCASQLIPVVRQRPASGPERAVDAARALLDELRRQPSSAEESAGFSTEVPQRLTIAGPRRDDPAGTLRLSTPPDELPQLGLAQLVCTLAGTAAADGRRAVLLGGPGGEPPRSYPCTDDTRAHPENLRGS